jgi:tetratricopeptide (TPR) repeat protein
MADEIAERLIDEEKLEEAVVRLEQVLEESPSPGTELRLGSVLFRMGKLSDALAHARRAAEPESEHREDAVLLVAYCLRSLKRFREAAKTYVAFAEGFPRSDRARMSRFSAALCLEELDDWTGAIELYAAIGDDESDFRRAICLERAGKQDEAAVIFEAFIDRHAGSPEMLKVRYRLGAMRLRQGRIEDAIRHLEETILLGGETFIGTLARQLVDRARTKAAHTQMKLKHYS